VFVDDTEDNLAAAARLGMTVVFALDEDDVARDLRQIFDLPAL
jgi:putative hydrolase of the HAD superfamily